MKKIELTRGKFALVDDEDFEFLNQWKWYAQKSGKDRFYAVRCAMDDGKKKYIYMHRQILALTDRNIYGDHINGDSLNNQRSNLRVSTHKQNIRNCRSNGTNGSKYKGITFDKPTQKWRAQIMVDRKHYYLGIYEKDTDAAMAYNEAAKKHFGEFARLNEVA